MVEKITKWLYLEPLLFTDWVHLAEISKKVGRNHTVVRQYLNYFEGQGIVIKQILGRMTMYRLNLSYPLIIDVISLIEKERIIIRSKDLILKEFVEVAHHFGRVVLIFGSFVNDSKNARDIDLLVVGDIDKSKVKEIEIKLNKKVHLIKVDDLNEISSALRNEIRKKHLIINGTEEIVKWLI